MTIAHMTLHHRRAKNQIEIIIKLLYKPLDKDYLYELPLY
jgi:hypothetical protein